MLALSCFAVFVERESDFREREKGGCRLKGEGGGRVGFLGAFGDKSKRFFVTAWILAVCL